MNTAESRFIDRKPRLSRDAAQSALSARKAAALRAAKPATEAEWLRSVQEELPRFVPFLSGKCGLEFRGRILEIGAGSAWFSAELSKLPKVVEVIALDLVPDLLLERAPRVFDLLHAKTAKITRMTGDHQKLEFPNNHFDFVVASAVLYDAANIVQVLREAKRVLKPGGQFVAIREPVWPLMKLQSRSRKMARLLASGSHERFYTLAHYKEFFKQAALPLEVKSVTLSHGVKYYVDEMVNGLTHARYAFIGSKRGRAGRDILPGGPRALSRPSAL